MIDDNRISETKWLEVLLWFRSAPHQVRAAIMLYDAISKSDPCLLDSNAEWFRCFCERDKLVKSALHSEGE